MRNIQLILVLILLGAIRLPGTGDAVSAMQYAEEGSILAIAWSPDGQQFATVDSDGNYYIYDANTGEIERTLLQSPPDEYSAGVASLSWSPDGSMFAATEYENVRVWDTSDWTRIATLQTSDYRVDAWSLSWSPDNSKIAVTSGQASGQYAFGIWDVASKTKVMAMLASLYVYSVDWSPDGTELATTGGTGVTIWNTSSTEADHYLMGDGEIVKALWSPNGDRIAAVGEVSLQVWDTSTGERVLLKEDQPRNHYHIDIAWSPDGRAILTSSDIGSIYVWDAATGEVLNIIQEEFPIKDMAFRPDGQKLAYVGAGNTLVIEDTLAVVPPADRSQPVIIAPQ